MFIYQAADIFFVVFHTALILFNLLGWIWKPLRRANLIALVLTGLSWFLLGLFFGIGYCPFTDWHFQVLSEMGRHPASHSYIEYFLQRITGSDLEVSFIDSGTIVLYFIVLAISIYFNFFKR